MIDIKDKSLCTGCTACVSACPVQCIVMRRDREEGFDYPVANPDLCIGCGKCESVCPVLNPMKESRPMASFAARCGNDMKDSSSGGVFPKLASEVIANGGKVYGAAFDEEFNVVHIEIADIEGINELRGSKYVQSELYSAFEDVRYELDEGRKVLFSGTPCQVAGLRKYLGKDSPLLLTVDCACHGVPGPGLWTMYRKALTERHGALKHVAFRDKGRGWCHYDFNVNGKVVPYMKDPYMALFAQDMTLRPSCYRCPARNGRSGSDLTLADLWNVAEVVPEMNDDRGVSLVCVNTVKGRDAFESVRSCLDVKPVVHELAIKNNGGFAEQVQMPERRAEFFIGMHSAKDLHAYMTGFVVRKSLPVRAYKTARSLLVKLKRKILK